MQVCVFLHSPDTVGQEINQEQMNIMLSMEFFIPMKGGRTT